MTTKLLLSCDGCHAKVTSERWLQRRFNSFSGKGYGFGVWEHDTPQDIAPEGWIISDPYTGCTYCPECWVEITKDEAS